MNASRFSAAGTICAAVCLLWAAAWGKNVMKVKTVDGIRIELHVLPAEPFFTADEAAAKHATAGMLIMGGAAPVAPDAESKPNHHLVVHVFDAKTGKAVTDATVSMSFRPIDASGKPSGDSVEVPVVVMQAIGKGAQSTHYGNNVTMSSGKYSVAVTVNGKKAAFKIDVDESKAGAMEGMHGR
jgi:hypothetical protein